MERTYWNQIEKNVEHIYGTDTEGSLVNSASFNLQKLGTILDVLKESHAGINTSYLYFGRWGTTFVWHIEDRYLYGINTLAYGAAKVWYCIPPEQAKKFEEVAKNLLLSKVKNSYKGCRDFLQHKVCLIHPDILRKHGITVYTVRQEANETIIVFPNS